MTALAQGRSIVRGAPDPELTLEDIAKADEVHVGATILGDRGARVTVADLERFAPNATLLLTRLSLVRFGRMTAYHDARGTWTIRDIKTRQCLVAGIEAEDAITHAAFLAEFSR